MNDQDYGVHPVAAPELLVPSSPSTVTVHLLHPLGSRAAPTSDLFFPPIPGFSNVVLPSHAFLVSHTYPGTDTPTHVLFDLSIRRDWKTGFPPVFTPHVTTQPISAHPKFNIFVAQDVPTLLSQSTNPQIQPSSISAVIWSHHHFDNRGDISLFPPSTQLILGPNLRSTYSVELYPTNPGGELSESDFQNRYVRQLTDSEFTLSIGNFPAHDYFFDGSLYLLSAPGHTAGHLAALARVTSTPSGSTFVLMAGDSAHHPGVFRPSPYLPLPKQNTLKNTSTSVASTNTTCRTYPNDLISSSLHPHPSANAPFINPDTEPMCHNTQQTAQTVANLQIFDAHDDVLVCIAHDDTLVPALPVFPETLNDWKANGLKEKVRWLFLMDSDTDG